LSEKTSKSETSVFQLTTRGLLGAVTHGICLGRDFHARNRRFVGGDNRGCLRAIEGIFVGRMTDLTTESTATKTPGDFNGSHFDSSGDDGEIVDGCLGKGIINDLPQRRILLTKGSSGLGFNIRGGIDAPYVKSDKGIFIVKIHRDGAAFKDGRLRVGDKIISINDIVLDGLRHEEVVSHFVSAGDVVRLHVLQGAGPVLKEFESLLQSSVKLQRKNIAPVIPESDGDVDEKTNNNDRASQDLNREGTSPNSSPSSSFGVAQTSSSDQPSTSFIHQNPASTHRTPPVCRRSPAENHLSPAPVDSFESTPPPGEGESEISDGSAVLRFAEEERCKNTTSPVVINHLFYRHVRVGDGGSDGGSDGGGGGDADVNVNLVRKREDRKEREDLNGDDGGGDVDEGCINAHVKSRPGVGGGGAGGDGSRDLGTETKKLETNGALAGDALNSSWEGVSNKGQNQTSDPSITRCSFDDPPLDSVDDPLTRAPQYPNEQNQPTKRKSPVSEEDFFEDDDDDFDVRDVLLVAPTLNDTVENFVVGGEGNSFHADGEESNLCCNDDATSFGHSEAILLNDVQDDGGGVGSEFEPLFDPIMPTRVSPVDKKFTYESSSAKKESVRRVSEDERGPKMNNIGEDEDDNDSKDFPTYTRAFTSGMTTPPRASLLVPQPTSTASQMKSAVCNLSVDPLPNSSEGEPELTSQSSERGELYLTSCQSSGSVAENLCSINRECETATAAAAVIDQEIQESFHSKAGGILKEESFDENSAKSEVLLESVLPQADSISDKVMHEFVVPDVNAAAATDGKPNVIVNEFAASLDESMIPIRRSESFADVLVPAKTVTPTSASRVSLSVDQSAQEKSVSKDKKLSSEIASLMDAGAFRFQFPMDSDVENSSKKEVESKCGSSVLNLANSSSQSEALQLRQQEISSRGLEYSTPPQQQHEAPTNGLESSPTLMRISVCFAVIAIICVGVGAWRVRQR